MTIKNVASGWTLTDPDNLQYGRKLKDKVYEFREFDRFRYPALYEQFKKLPLDPERGKFVYEYWDVNKMWMSAEIDLNRISDKDVTDCISGYGYTIESLQEYYEDPYWIIAECIFEEESVNL